MKESTHIYHHGSQELHGFVAYNEEKNTPRPAVLVAHDWTGRNDFACNQARLLADLGYIGFALDMYGEAQLGGTPEEKRALMQPLVTDRTLLVDRLKAAFSALAAMPQVDKDRIAIIGFCFGGLCALDLARSGADFKGAVSFHGLLNKPADRQTQAIKAKILVLHGYDDPMAQPQQVLEFCQEMTEAKANWQVDMYGHVHHSFTNPEAHDAKSGLIYNSLAANRSWQSMINFLHEIF